MKAWLMLHRHALQNTVRHFKKHPWATLINLFVVTLTVTLPLIGYTLLFNLQPLSSHLSHDPELTVFMLPQATSAETNTVQQQLLKYPNVTNMKFIERSTALEEMKTHANLREALAQLPYNPLPDAFIVQIKPPPSVNPANFLEDMASQLRQLPKVDNVQVDSTWIKRLNSLLHLFRNSVQILSLILGSAIVSILFNTIRLEILNQREEIEITKLFGATNAFIRRPFLYQGTLQGLGAGILAIFFIFLILIPVNHLTIELAQLTQTHLQLHSLPLIHLFFWLALTTLLGWLGALLSVNRYLSQLD